MADGLLLLGLLAVAIASVIRDIHRGRQISELREQLKLLDQLKPFAEITAAALEVYEARSGRHDVMAELQAEKNLLAKVRELLKLE